MKSFFLGMSFALVSPVLFTLAAEARTNSPESFRAVRQARSYFPKIISQWESKCEQKFLGYKLSDDGNRLFANCWEQRSDSRAWDGNYLGKLPLTPSDPSFTVNNLTCGSGATACQTVLPKLRSQYPNELQDAELQCATLSGRLSFYDAQSSQFKPDPNSNAMELQCLFESYWLTDENGNGVQDVEDTESSAGVSESVLKVQLANEISQRPSSEAEEWEAFFNSDYTYWDAKVLSDFWNQDVSDAKARIGRKLIWGTADQALLEQFLLDARLQALQSVEQLALFSQASYSYDDAKELAEFWGDSTPYDAKLRIERNLILGNEQLVKDALTLAQRS